MNRLRLLAIIAALSIAACEAPDSEPDTPKITAEDIARETREAADAIAGFARDRQREVEQQARERLAALEVDIERLREQAGAAGAETRARLDAEIRRLESQWERSRQRLAELEEKSGPAWDELRAGLDEAMADLSDAYHRAKERLQKD